MSKDTRDNNARAALWLLNKIRQATREAEREFGVYIAVAGLNTRAGYIDDMQYVELTARVWPASMRIIETESESKALG